METYWDNNGRCVYCGASDDNHHSFPCPTGFHQDRRSIYEQVLFNRIKALEQENAELKDYITEKHQQFIKICSHAGTQRGEKENLRDQLSDLRAAAAWLLHVIDSGIIPPHLLPSWFAANEQGMDLRKIQINRERAWCDEKYCAESTLRALLAKIE